MHNTTRKRSLSRAQAGFSLLEIIIALAIVALIAGVTITALSGTLGKSSEKIAKLFVKDSLKTPLMSYRIDLGSYPSTADGLQALLEAPSGKEKRWGGPYVEELPEDPWGNPYQYRFPGAKNPAKYDAWSWGPDGLESEDDIGNW